MFAGGSARSAPIGSDRATVWLAAYFDRGILHLTVKKPLAAVEAAKNIEIKLGAPPAGPTVVEATKEPLKAA